MRTASEMKGDGSGPEQSKTHPPRSAVARKWHQSSLSTKDERGVHVGAKLLSIVLSKTNRARLDLWRLRRCSVSTVL